MTKEEEQEPGDVEKKSKFDEFVSNLEQDGAYIYVTISIEKGLIDLKVTPANIENGKFDRVIAAGMDFMKEYNELYSGEPKDDKHNQDDKDVA